LGISRNTCFRDTVKANKEVQATTKEMEKLQSDSATCVSYKTEEGGELYSSAEALRSLALKKHFIKTHLLNNFTPSNVGVFIAKCNKK